MKLTAGILAGGKSSRMGANKAFLKTEGITFLERTMGLFGSLPDVDELFISAAEKKGYEEICGQAREQASASGKHFGLVLDERQGYGPLEGVYRLLLASCHTWVFVAAVDMPCINRDVIQYIMHYQREEAWAVLPRAGGRIHPLFGLYSKKVIPVIEEMFRKEVHKIGRIQEWVPVKIVDLTAEGQKEMVLANVNTPWEYEKICKAGLCRQTLDTERKRRDL